MGTAKKAKPSKKSPARKPAARKTATKKPVVKVRRKKSGGAKFALSLKSLKAIQGRFKALQNYWIFGLVGAIAIIAFGLMQLSNPVPAPAPLAAVPAQSAPVQQQPVAQQAPPAQPAQPPLHIDPPKPAEPAKVAQQGPLAKEFTDVDGKGLEDRIDYWSAFLSGGEGAHDRLASLGGAPEIQDSAPLIPARFDCTTFVETVMALSRSHAGDEFYRNLLSIRYRDGKPTFLTRNHFPEADWIPNNEKAGILHDVTWEIAQEGGAEKLVEKKEIDRVGWLAKQVKKGKVDRALASVNDPLWSGKSDAIVPYVALADVPKIQKKIPSGAVLNIVRRDKSNMPVIITHQGFVIQKDGKTLLRHASVGGNIRTVALTDYLSELNRKAESKDWPLVGINLNQVAGR